MCNNGDPRPPGKTNWKGCDRVALLSFFTGGGFFDLGFERAGFEVRWSNEFDETIADLHDYAYTQWRKAESANAPEGKISCRRSIIQLRPEEILEQAFDGHRPDVFGVIGGPPCTDFSAGGMNAGSEGSNGRLTGVYVNKLLQLRPAFFVLENVPALKRNQKHGKYFEKKLRLLSDPYNVHVKLVNALDLGAAQDRERLFVIGIRKDLDSAGHAFEWPSEPRFVGAKFLKWPQENPFRNRALKPEGLPEELMVHTALGRDRGVEHLPNGKEWFKPYSKKFNIVPEGRVSTKSFKRLHRFRYSPTAWYGNNEVHLHPTEARRLSVREALRLQTVPDDYELPEDAPLSRKFKLICNGVPVLLAEKIATAVRVHLSKLTPLKKQSLAAPPYDIPRME